MLHVITPSRGRPASALRLREALRATCAGEWRLYLCVDNDDRLLLEYRRIAEPSTTSVIPGPRKGLTEWTNLVARSLIVQHGARWLASLGDDHVPRSVGWDRQLIGAIVAMDGPGWAYGDDLLQGENLPTAWVQSAEIMSALGWMLLPACEHLMVDVAVRDLGLATKRIAYLPDVVVEHMHSANGKAPFDATYEHGNSAQRVRIDGTAYHAWHDSDEFTVAVDTVRDLRWGASGG